MYSTYIYNTHFPILVTVEFVLYTIEVNAVGCLCVPTDKNLKGLRSDECEVIPRELKVCSHTNSNLLRFFGVGHSVSLSQHFRYTLYEFTLCVCQTSLLV